MLYNTNMPFVPAYHDTGEQSLGIYLFAYHGQALHILPDNPLTPETCLPFIPDWQERKPLFFGFLDDRPCYCLLLEKSPSGLVQKNIRELLTSLPDDFLEAVLKGQVLSWWYASHSFCGFCGLPTQRDPQEWAMVCDSCGHRSYPRISPAVIVRITKGDNLLLARNREHPEGFFSHVAGFVDPGENLEQAVVREVREEVGVTIGNLVYFGSQAWTVSQSLIVGFTAEYCDGDIVPDGKEIAEAHWFTIENLPLLPRPGSLSRKMIDDFVKNGLT